MVFTGDIMGHDTQIASALATGEPGYDYRPCFQYLEPYLQQADLVVGNLEVTLAGPPYKGYPRFSSPDELADALKEAGFDILVTANNHALDRGTEGLIRTQQQLHQRELLFTGTFTDGDQRKYYYPLLFEKNGIRVALLNYTYSTNGLKVKPPAIVNSIDTALIRSDLEKAATGEPDFILVAMHWGGEYQLTESARQRELARFLFSHGADAILGSHPHVVQPVRGRGKGSLVAYSMGNLISNQRKRYRDGGILVELQLVKEWEHPGDPPDGADSGPSAGMKPGASGKTYIAGHSYLPVWVWKPVTRKGTLFTLVPASVDPSALSGPVMTAGDRATMAQFLRDTRAQLKGQTEITPWWIGGRQTIGSLR